MSIDASARTVQAFNEMNFMTQSRFPEIFKYFTPISFPANVEDGGQMAGNFEAGIPATLTVAGKWRTMGHGFKIPSLKPPEDSP